MRNVAALWLCTLLLAGLAGPASAASVFWTKAGDGDWSETASWSGGYVPAYTDVVNVVSNGYQVTLTTSGNLASNVYVGYAAGRFGRLRLESGADLTVGNYLYLSTYQMPTGYLYNAGTLAATNLTMGGPVGAYASFTNDGGTLTVGNNMIVGGQTPADVTILGGTVGVRGTFSFGYNAGDFAALRFGGGTILSRTEFEVGRYGVGEMNQTGGDLLYSGGAIYIGRNPSGRGTYTMTAGTIRCTNQAPVFYVGSSGTGYLAKSGGTIHACVVVVGNAAGSFGAFTNSGGDVTITNYLRVGDSGTGAAWWQDGFLGVTQNLDVGYSVGGSGTFNLEGGTVTCRYATVGLNGTGTWYQTGGFLVATGASAASYGFSLGQNAAGNGRFVMTGGSNQIDRGTFFVGYDGTGSVDKSEGFLNVSNLTVGGRYGRGVFTNSGGGVAVRGNLVVADAAGADGQLVWSNGTLDVNNSTVLAQGGAGHGSIVQYGGTISISNQFNLGRWGRGDVTLYGGTCVVGKAVSVALYNIVTGILTVAGGTLQVLDGTDTALAVGGGVSNRARVYVQGGAVTIAGGVQSVGALNDTLIDVSTGSVSVALGITSAGTSAHRFQIGGDATLDVRGLPGGFGQSSSVAWGYTSNGSNTWTQAGGSVTMTNGLYIGGFSSTYSPLARYDLSAGTVLASNLTVSAFGTNMFNFTAKSHGTLYVRTIGKNKAQIESLITGGQIRVEGVLATPASFQITELAAGPHAGYTEVMLQSVGGSTFMIR